MATFDPSSREREAHEEIAATRIGRGAAVLLTAAALGLVVLALALEGAALARRGSSLVERWSFATPADGLAWLTWNRQTVVRLREIDRRVDQGSALARTVRPWGQLALTSLARYGNEEAYVGELGWLVYRPDFDHLTGSGYLEKGGRPSPVDAISTFAGELARRGVALLLLPVPAKPAVHPESLAERTPTEGPRNVDDRALADRLRALDVAVLDPLDLLRRAALVAPGYLATDTHWRPDAMDAVARETAIRLRAMVELPIGDETARREEPGHVEGSGDTAALLDLPVGQRRFAPESVAIRRVVDAEGKTWRPTPKSSVLLLGDSFSAIYSQAELGFGTGAGFAERLSFHLALPIDRLVRNAGGASATREALAEELARDPERFTEVRVVVWQFAARELTQGEWRPVSFASTAPR